MPEELGEDAPFGARRLACCELGHDHVWWKDKTYCNEAGWFLHGWLYLVLCIWCGKKTEQDDDDQDLG